MPQPRTKTADDSPSVAKDDMRREFLLTIASVAVTLGIALALIRWYAPGLLGYAVDQRMVRTSKVVPPFYQNVFRQDDYASDAFLLSDPDVVTRAKPLFPDLLTMGPNDILGFRNRSVPNTAEIVAIGDSQTYGNNAALEYSWPGHLQRELYGNGHGRVYNMSVGAWGGINYRRIMESALRFRPKAVVVAFYTGNDSLTDFRNVYSLDELAHLRVDPELDVGDLPRVTFPVPAEDVIEVSFPDGVITAFTPRYRLLSNRRRDPTVIAGYAIMERMAEEMASRLAEFEIAAVFTIIPTKELVYAKKVTEANIKVNETYQELVADERHNIDGLASAIQDLPHATYVDVLTPLEAAASTAAAIYPTSGNGHPLAAGYGVIARAIAASLDREQVATPNGFFALQRGKLIHRLVVATHEGQWSISRREVIEGNGWSSNPVPIRPLFDVSSLPYLGEIVTIDPKRFGPPAD